MENISKVEKDQLLTSKNHNLQVDSSSYQEREKDFFHYRDLKDNSDYDTKKNVPFCDLKDVPNILKFFNELTESSNPSLYEGTWVHDDKDDQLDTHGLL